MAKHTGSCHCGNVKFEVETDLEGTIACNCSVCTKRGSLLNFVPAEKFKLISGEDKLTDYLWNKRIIHHLFCKNCGILPFGKGVDPNGNETVAINIRCLDDVDIDSVKITPFDGRSM